MIWQKGNYFVRIKKYHKKWGLAPRAPKTFILTYNPYGTDFEVRKILYDGREAAHYYLAYRNGQEKEV